MFRIVFSPRNFNRRAKKAVPKGNQIKEPIKYDSEEYIKEALLDILIYMIFLVAITIVANTVQHLYMFYFNQTLQRSFLDRIIETDMGTELTFNELVTTADWWLFMERVLLANLHGISYDWNDHDKKEEENKSKESEKEETEEEKETEKDEEEKEEESTEKTDTTTGTESFSRIYLRDNILMGPPRLRQIRVRENACQVHDVFLTYFRNCYPGYTKSDENITGIYHGSKYYTRSELQANFIRGRITNYYGGGYIVNLSYSFKENQKIFKNLKKDKWIDRGTRLVIFEFVLFNTNSYLFDNVKIMAELPPVGGIVPSHHFQALNMKTLWTDGYWVSFAAGIILWITVLFYTIEKIALFFRIGPKLFFASVWNYLDIIVLILSYFCLIYNLVHPSYISDIINLAEDDTHGFISIDYICYYNLLYIDIMATCVFLVWVKIFKYISYNKTMLQFSTTLKRCAVDLFGFAVMFFIVLLAYAQLGLLIFGSSHPDFREFSISVITLMRMFLGDFEYQLLEESNHVLGPIYFLSYVLFVFFILLNMFLAIINDTYGAVKGEILKDAPNLGPYAWRLFVKTFSWCLPKKESKSEALENLDLRNRDEVSNTTPYPASTIHSTLTSSPQHVRKRQSEILREYFEDVPQVQEPNMVSKHTEDLQRFDKRITLLEEVLEQLINNLDDILKQVEAKKSKKSNKTI